MLECDWEKSFVECRDKTTIPKTSPDAKRPAQKKKVAVSTAVFFDFSCGPQLFFFFPVRTASRSKTIGRIQNHPGAFATVESVSNYIQEREKKRDEDSSKNGERKTYRQSECCCCDLSLASSLSKNATTTPPPPPPPPPTFLAALAAIAASPTAAALNSSPELPPLRSLIGT